MDIFAGFLELFASYKIGEKKKICFVVQLLANLLWIGVAFTENVYGLLICVVPAMVLNVINYWKWSVSDKSHRHKT